MLPRKGGPDSFSALGAITEFQLRPGHIPGDRYEIQIMSRDGQLRMLLRCTPERERVTHELMDMHIAQRIAASRDTKRQADLRRLRHQSDAFPEFIPAHGELRVGTSGELWVQDYLVDLDGPSSWRVFGSDGRLLAVIETPERYTVMSVGADWIAGVWQDDLDVEYVRVYRLDRP